MGALSERYSMEPARLLETIKATCIKGVATNEQVQAFLIVANRYGLDPFLKEIHAFAGQGGGIVPIVGIDGWTRIANSTGQLDGQTFEFSGDGPTLACTCTIYVKGRTHPTVITEYMAECGRNTAPWKQYPRRMLRHKAYMQCARVAFGLGGIYDEDEARDVMANEGGGRATMSRLAELNAAIAAPIPHPTEPTQVIDQADASEPAFEDEGPAVTPPDLSSYDGWKAAMQSVGIGGSVSEADIGGAIARLTLDHSVQLANNKGNAARKLTYEAALNGALDWQTGKLVG